MSDRSDPPAAAVPPADPLETLVVQCCERIEREGPDALAAMCQEHPNHAAELRAAVTPLLRSGLLASPAPQPPAGGRRLGEFELVRELGRGGMGVVYEAVQHPLGRRVALKVMQAHLTLDEVTVARFRREGRTAAGLQHPGIVQVHTVGSDGDHHFIAMEYVVGTPLDRVLAALRQRRPEELTADDLRQAVSGAEHAAADAASPESDGSGSGRRGSGSGSATRPVLHGRSYVAGVVDLAARVGDALHHAHEAGVVHRDVKPSNILVRPDGAPVLTDFGLARRDDQPGLTRTGSFAGTPYYTAPEQAAARGPVDRRADVFSLGATLFELLTLRRPFPGNDSREVLQQILFKEPLDPQRLNRALAPDLCAVVQKALEKDRERRYPTAAALADDLRAFLAYQPVQARRPTALGRLRRWARRQPVLAALVALLLLGFPLVTALLGYVIAKAPMVAAAEQAQLRARAEQDLLRGFLALGNRELAAAEAAFHATLADDPDDADAVAGLVLVEEMRNRADPAAAHRVLDQRPGLVARHRALQRLAASAMELRGETAAAGTILERLGPPRDPLELFLQGWDDLRFGDRDMRAARHEAAFRQLLTAVLAAPAPRPLYLSLLGSVADRLRNGPVARAVADALTAHWPDSGLAWMSVGVTLTHIDPPGAIAAFQRAAELLPDDPRPRSNLAGLLLEQGQGDEAIAMLRQLLAQHPGHAPGHLRLGRALALAGQTEAALAPLERAQELSPADPQVAHWLIQVRLRLGRVDEAARHAEAMVRGIPDNPVMWLDLAYAQLSRRDATAARISAQRVIELQPDQPDTWALMASVEIMAGDFPAARTCHERRVSCSPPGEAAWKAREDLIRFLLRPMRGQPPLDLAAAVELARALDQETAQRRAATRHLLAIALAADGSRDEARAIVQQTLAAIADGSLTAPPDVVSGLEAMRGGL